MGVNQHSRMGGGGRIFPLGSITAFSNTGFVEELSSLNLATSKCGSGEVFPKFGENLKRRASLTSALHFRELPRSRRTFSRLHSGPRRSRRHRTGGKREACRVIIDDKHQISLMRSGFGRDGFRLSGVGMPTISFISRENRLCKLNQMMNRA